MPGFRERVNRTIDRMLDIAPAPEGARAPAPAPPPMQELLDPKIAAEKLLRRVLPEELHVSLGALGYCDVPGKTHKSYRIFKNQKTHVTDKQGNVYSSCIHLTDTEAPDTDRIVAEYLLIINDEAKYLDTANLTQILSESQANRNSGRTHAELLNAYQHMMQMMGVGQNAQNAANAAALQQRALMNQYQNYELHNANVLALQNAQDQWNAAMRISGAAPIMYMTTTCGVVPYFR